jgi:hypothetical protein
MICLGFNPREVRIQKNLFTDIEFNSVLIYLRSTLTDERSIRNLALVKKENETKTDKTQTEH